MKNHLFGEQGDARALKLEFNLKRQILLDDLEGSAHLAYGMLPNMSWIIGSGGTIRHKAAWTDPADIEDALKYSVDALEHGPTISSCRTIRSESSGDCVMTISSGRSSSRMVHRQ